MSQHTTRGHSNVHTQGFPAPVTYYQAVHASCSALFLFKKEPQDDHACLFHEFITKIVFFC